MFFQTAKAIVTSLCSRHIVRKKISLNGAIGRPNQIPTLVKDNARTDVFGLQNETTVNKFSPSTVINNAKKTTKNTIPTKTPAYEDDVTIFKERTNGTFPLRFSCNTAIQDAALKTLLRNPVRVSDRLKLVLEAKQSEINRRISIFSTKIFNSCSIRAREFCTLSNKSQEQSEMLTRYGPHYLYSPCKVWWREFHRSLCRVERDKSCKETKEIYKTEEKRGESLEEKSDRCRREKVKCEKSQHSDEKNKKTEVKEKTKTERKNADFVCRKTCFGRGKCDMPQTIPPPKMEYAKITCPPPKFVKPNLYAPIMTEYTKKENNSRVETSRRTKTQNRQICAPPPLPKPPCEPLVLCACPPPSKLHPGSCPHYDIRVTSKKPSIGTCLLKKKEYPCPTGVHYCPPKKIAYDLEKKITLCDHRQKKEVE
ncbi:uncharacterized protein LOC109861963 isoform X2 [Pseudomyrmex gracilis]|uniref:uncharacterized protein LOC109861963 isoform X2 n=1 Tax=Pseudomyrmex gracilis TaxID=219809 RepID=UPI00099539AB|nr:uncharacterized protein LOC109861963 isoform X2 [Pseudomyrmex gracilis]